MILYIDSTDFNRVTYALKYGGKVKSRVFKIDPHKSHETLAKLDQFLKSAGVKSTPLFIPPLKRGGKEQKIQKIIVNKGPGSFTGTRVGVTHALALGFAWGVKVVALEKDKFDLNLNAN